MNEAMHQDIVLRIFRIERESVIVEKDREIMDAYGMFTLLLRSIDRK